MVSRFGLVICAPLVAYFLVAATTGSAAEWRCDGRTGLSEPLPVCSSTDPCTDLLPTYRLRNPGMRVIDRPEPGLPFCGTGPRGERAGRPVYDDGPPRQVQTEGDGLTRHYCRYRPPSAAPNSPLPLVVFVHGSGGHGGTLYDATSLRGKAENFDLTGDPSRRGFVLIGLQSRYLHWPNASPQDGSKFDSYYRDYLRNPDVEYVDRVIDGEVAGGGIDPNRIYLMGWSNGARFAAFYGLRRHHVLTPKGNRIGAVAVFSGGDPFENIRGGYRPTCKVANYPRSRLPLYMISRACDLIACNGAQADRFRSMGMDVPPGNVVGSWITTLYHRIEDPYAEWQRIDFWGRPVDACAPADRCTRRVAVRNHIFWPDGIGDGSGIDWEPPMLDFLKRHPLERR